MRGMSDSPILCTIDLDGAREAGRHAAGAALVEPERLVEPLVPIVSVANGAGPDGARARRRPRRRAGGPGRRAQPRPRAPAGAGHRPRDRDPVRLARGLARLHAALAVGREPEPLVPRLSDRPGRRAARALPLDRALPARRRRRRHPQRRAQRPLPALVRDALGRRRRRSGGRWSTGCSRWNTDWCCVYIDIARHRPARRRGGAAGEDRRQHRARRRRARHGGDPPARASGLANVLRHFGALEGEVVRRADWRRRRS